MFVLLHFRDPVSSIPTLPLILLRDLHAGSRRQLAGGQQRCSLTQSPSRPSFPFLPKNQVSSTTSTLLKDSGFRKPPVGGSQESQLQRLPRTKESEPSIPKSQASGPSFLCSVHQVSEFSPSKDPDVCAPPMPPWDPASESPPNPPRDPGAGVLQNRWTPGRGGVELTDPGQILVPGGFLRLRLRLRGAEDGAGQAPGTG